MLSLRCLIRVAFARRLRDGARASNAKACKRLIASEFKAYLKALRVQVVLIYGYWYPQKTPKVQT